MHMECNESSVQVGQNGGVFILVNSDFRSMHSIIPNKREWLYVLFCINATKKCLLIFYIFKGKKLT
jgi:hypothetical protein